MGVFDSREMFEDEERDEKGAYFFRIDGNQIIVERKDPYGHWYIHLKHGQLADSLKGSFTSKDEARKAVIKYMALRKRKIRGEGETING